ncbi:hypothetical protein QUF75_07360 [Desulfococcaceae bacterium HSG7]|nr:hypothetical protein [Desulfococcaceae bacterium HSG7]
MPFNIANILISLTTVAEISVLCAAGFILFRKWGATFAEGAAYSLITTMMLLSFFMQLAFLTGFPDFSLRAEILTCALAAAVICKYRHHLRQARQILLTFLSQYPLVTVAIVIGGVFMIYLAALPSENIQTISLYQVQTFHQQGSFFADASFAQNGQPLRPVNLSSLSLFLLQRNASHCSGIFSMMAWIAIAFATYALARRYAWPPAAFTVTMITISFPRLVHLAVTGSQEIIAASVAVFCLLAIYRAVEQPDSKDLLLFILGLFFGISGDDLGFLFPVILTMLACVLLFRRHGALAWWKLIIGCRWYVLALVVLPLFIFSQCWLFSYNQWMYGQWIGLTCEGVFTFNADGIIGALANMVRYLIASAHFMLPAERLCQYLFGFSPTESLMGFYQLAINPYIGNQGAASVFALAWTPDARLLWFGPFGFLFVLPALLYALIRGPRRLKAIAIALAGYFYMIALIPAWRPENVRFFTLFFACGGYFSAFFLPPWRLTRIRKSVLQIACLLLLGYACWSNVPFIH